MPKAYDVDVVCMCTYCFAFSPEVNLNVFSCIDYIVYSASNIVVYILLIGQTTSPHLVTKSLSVPDLLETNVYGSI